MDRARGSNSSPIPAKRHQKVFSNNKFWDVTIVVENDQFPAHRAILSKSCEFFRVLFDGGTKESLGDEVVLTDVPAREFEALLTFIYSGRLRVEELSDDEILRTLGLAHFFVLETAVVALREYIRIRLSIEKVCRTFERVLHLSELLHLREGCCLYMCHMPHETLRCIASCHLSAEGICQILSLDTFYAEEIAIFRAVSAWRAKQPRGEPALSEVLEVIRLPLIDFDTLVSTVKNSGLVAPEVIEHAIRTQETQVPDLEFRATLVRDSNLANSIHNAMELTAEASKKSTASKSLFSFRAEFIPEVLVVDPERDLVIALSKPHFVNHIAFRLPNKISCSYHLEVSVDFENWYRVIDYTKYRCRSRQKLHFETRAVRFVRVMVSNSAAVTPIELTDFQVSYVTRLADVIDGFRVPKENVALAANGAVILEPPYPYSDGMLSGRRKVDDGILGWSVCAINYGTITVQLAQPVVVDSVRFYVRGTEKNPCYVETSLDQITWTRVADHRTAQGWQIITFKQHPVLYVKIACNGPAIGSYELLCFTFFECPAQVRSLEECSAWERNEEGERILHNFAETR